MSHLYELTGQMIGLQRLIEDGEMDDEALQDTLEGLEGDLQAKAEGLLSYVANVGSDVSAIDVEIKRLQARKTTMVNRQNSLREYLKLNMVAGDIQKITCPLFSITLTKPRDVCVIDHADRLPESFVKTKTTVMPVKADILRALKEGFDVPGASLGKSQPGLLIK